MKPEIKAKWLDALRSGEYQQGHSMLVRITDDGVTHCCLGVLCKIAVDEGVDVVMVTNELGPHTKNVSYDNNDSTLPLSVREWAGMDTFNGGNPVVTDEEHGRNSLAEFNDNGKTFNEIADIIERSL